MAAEDRKSLTNLPTWTVSSFWYFVWFQNFVSRSWCKLKNSSHSYWDRAWPTQKTIYVYWVSAQDTRMVSSHWTDVMSVLEIVSAQETRRKFQMMQVPVCQRYFHCIYNVCILDWLVTCMLLRNLNFLCIIRLFVWVFLGFVWGLSSHKFFIHMETSLLPVKGCTFWPMLGTNTYFTFWKQCLV